MEETSHDDELIEPTSAQLKNYELMPNSLEIEGFDVVADDSMMSSNSPKRMKYAATEIELRQSYNEKQHPATDRNANKISKHSTMNSSWRD